VRRELLERDVITHTDSYDAFPAATVAPAPPARPAAGTMSRTRATLALLGVIATLGALWRQSDRYRDDPYGLARPPFKLEAKAWRSVLTVAATTERSCPASVPVVALYVNASCPHCRAELRRWANLLGSGAPQVACIGVAVVAAPSRTPGTTDWVPPELLPMLLWDHDGTVAGALQVRLVPVTAYVTRSGVVVERVIGEASEQSTLPRLDRLHQTSNDGRGAP
jgi:hypothetical protein